MSACPGVLWYLAVPRYLPLFKQVIRIHGHNCPSPLFQQLRLISVKLLDVNICKSRWPCLEHHESPWNLARHAQVARGRETSETMRKPSSTGNCLVPVLRALGEPRCLQTYPPEQVEAPKFNPAPDTAWPGVWGRTTMWGKPTREYHMGSQMTETVQLVWSARPSLS